MGLIKEFKEFAIQGNAVEMAVGVVIGAAFKAIVDAIVENIITPLIGLIGGNAAEGWIVNVGSAQLNIGALIGAIINFIAVAFILFLFVKATNKLRKKNEEEPAPAPEPSNEEKLLTEIRDALKK